MSRTRRRPTRLLLALSLLLTTAVAVVGAPPAPPAQAADLTLFDPGHIISDAVFYDTATMTATGVQRFLEEKGARCTSGTDICLKDYRMDTYDRPADTRCTRPYTGAAGESAARIIAKVAAACGINPQVILVKLQKEQGLVTATTPRPESTYIKAMGFRCPDFQGCDPKYAGFFNQVYSAAWQLRNYALNPLSFNHRVGVVNQVRYHPNVDCGSGPVLIQNQATASLYNYTPFQPNAAALAAGYGVGDECSAYGNRNFWNFFSDWFGSPTQRPPFGRVDAVTAGAGVVTVRGWAIDPDTHDSIDVEVRVDGRVVGTLRADQPRPDVQRAHRRGELRGFEGTLPAAAGSRRVCVVALDATGGSVNPQIGCATVTVVNNPPIGRLDSVTAVPGGFAVRGWAFDPDITGPVSVHLYANGRIVGRVTASDLRRDVARVYPGRTEHGYSGTFGAATGRYQVCAFAINSPRGSNPRIGCRTVDVVNAPPRGSLDGVSSQIGEVSARGWAFDPDTSDSIRVRMRVDGVVVAERVADDVRRDVARVFDRGENHGYRMTAPAEPGERTVCVEAVDASTRATRTLNCRTVLVNGLPFGTIDQASDVGGAVRVQGWAIDPNTTDPIRVHVYVDGRAVASLLADRPRPDVDAVHGMGPNHGFDVTLPAEPGNRRVCAYGIDVQKERNPLLSCVTVAVR